FFSSRRRHTRFSRDWSSDVCSSDLDDLEVVETGKVTPEHRKKIAVQWQKAFIKKAFTTKSNPNPDDFSCLEWEHERLYIYTKDRSEERRVGKECRSRWSQ